MHNESHHPNVSFFFNDTATTEIYTLSLHDALPILPAEQVWPPFWMMALTRAGRARSRSASSKTTWADRKSTRLNSSHANISYAVFCLKKKNNFCLFIPDITMTVLQAKSQSQTSALP